MKNKFERTSENRNVTETCKLKLKGHLEIWVWRKIENVNVKQIENRNVKESLTSESRGNLKFEH